MKKTLAILLAGLLSLCIVSCGASQETENNESDNDNIVVEQNYTDEKDKKGKFTYERNENGDYEITKYEPYSAKAVDITLPQKINGVEVVGIAKDAFKAQNAIKGVTIPSTYEYIGDYAFYDCDALTKVTFDKGTKIESIGKGAFESCDLLADFKIPEGVTEIAEFTFKDCKAIKSMDLSNISKIQKGAFFNCSSLSSLTVSSNIQYATKEAFYGCDSLTYTEEGGLLYLGNAENKTILLVSPKSINITECAVSSTTKVIADAAFNNCQYLTSVKLSDAVEVINGTSFIGCSELELTKSENGLYLGTEQNPYIALIGLDITSVEAFTVHKDTKIITNTAFNNCQLLTNVVLSDSVKVIDATAFENCAKLTYSTSENGLYLGTEANPYMALIKLNVNSVEKFTLNKDTKVIAKGAFDNCTDLSGITFEGTAAEWDGIVKFADWNCGRNLSITCKDKTLKPFDK